MLSLPGCWHHGRPDRAHCPAGHAVVTATLPGPCLPQQGLRVQDTMGPGPGAAGAVSCSGLALAARPTGLATPAASPRRRAVLSRPWSQSMPAMPCRHQPSIRARAQVVAVLGMAAELGALAPRLAALPGTSARGTIASLLSALVTEARSSFQDFEASVGRDLSKSQGACMPGSTSSPCSLPRAGCVCDPCSWPARRTRQPWRSALCQ